MLIISIRVILLVIVEVLKRPAPRKYYVCVAVNLEIYSMTAIAQQIGAEVALGDVIDMIHTLQRNNQKKHEAVALLQELVRQIEVKRDAARAGWY